MRSHWCPVRKSRLPCHCWWCWNAEPSWRPCYKNKFVILTYCSFFNHAFRKKSFNHFHFVYNYERSKAMFENILVLFWKMWKYPEVFLLFTKTQQIPVLLLSCITVLNEYVQRTVWLCKTSEFAKQLYA